MTKNGGTIYFPTESCWSVRNSGNEYCGSLLSTELKAYEAALACCHVSWLAAMNFSFLLQVDFCVPAALKHGA